MAGVWRIPQEVTYAGWRIVVSDGRVTGVSGPADMPLAIVQRVASRLDVPVEGYAASALGRGVLVWAGLAWLWLGSGTRRAAYWAALAEARRAGEPEVPEAIASAIADLPGCEGDPLEWLLGSYRPIAARCVAAWLAAADICCGDGGMTVGAEATRRVAMLLERLVMEVQHDRVGRGVCAVNVGRPEAACAAADIGEIAAALGLTRESGGHGLVAAAVRIKAERAWRAADDAKRRKAWIYGGGAGPVPESYETFAAAGGPRAVAYLAALACFSDERLVAAFARDAAHVLDDATD